MFSLNIFHLNFMTYINITCNSLQRVRTEVKSLSSYSHVNIQLHKCNGVYSVRCKERKKANMKDIYLIECITTTPPYIVELFSDCKSGNFNIHICAWFGYEGKSGFISNLVKEIISCSSAQTCAYFIKS